MVADNLDQDKSISSQEQYASNPKLQEHILALEFKQVTPHQPMGLSSHPEQDATQPCPFKFHVAPW